MEAQKNGVDPEQSVELLKQQLEEKTRALDEAETNIIRLSKQCAELISQDLHNSEDRLSLDSSGSLSELDTSELRALRDEVLRLRQDESLYKNQIEVLTSSLALLPHPDDLRKVEEELRSRIQQLTDENQSLPSINMCMKADLTESERLESEVKRLESEIEKLTEMNEKKTSLIEKLDEKLVKYDEENSALLESLHEAENAGIGDVSHFSLTGDDGESECCDTKGGESNSPERDPSQLLARLNSMEDRDQRLRDRLQQLEDHEVELESELDTMKEQLKSSESISSSRAIRISELEDCVSELEAEKQSAASEVSELQSKYFNMKTILSQKMDELKLAREIVTESEATLKQLQRRCDSVTALEETIQTLNAELQLAKQHSQRSDKANNLLFSPPTFQEESRVDTTNVDDDDEESSLASLYEYQLLSESNVSDGLKMAELGQENANLKAQIEKLTSQANTVDVSVSNLNAKLRISQNVIDELKIQNRKLTAAATECQRDFDKQVKELNQELQSEKVQNSVHRDVISSMSPQIDHIKCENESLETKLRYLQDRIYTTELELDRKKSETESVREQLAIVNKQCRDLERDRSAVTTEIRSLLQLLDDESHVPTDLDKLSLIEAISSSQESLKTIQNEASNIKSLHSQTVSELEVKLRECEQFKEELDASRLEAEKVAADSENFVEQLKACRQQLDVLAMENDELKQKLMEKTSNQRSCENCTHHLAIMETLKQQIYSLNEERSTLQSRNDSLVLQIDQVLSEKQVYIDELTRLATHSPTVSSNEAPTRLSVDKATPEKLSAGVETQYNLEMNRLREKLDESVSENQEFLKKLDSLGLILSETENERDTLIEKLASANHDCDICGKELLSYKEQVIELTGINSALQQSSQQHLSDCKQMKDKLEHQIHANSELVSRVEQQNKCVEELEQTLEEERNKGVFRINQQARKHASELASLHETLAELKLEKETLSAKLKIVSAELAAQENMEQINEQLKAELESLQEANLENLVGSSTESCLLRAQLENLQEDAALMSKMLKDINLLEENAAVLRSDLESERSAHTASKAQLQLLQEEQLTFKETLEDIREKHEHAQLQCEELQSALSLSQQQTAEQVSGLKSQITSLSKELADSQSLHNVELEKHKKTGVELNQLRAQHDVMTSELEQLQQCLQKSTIDQETSTECTSDDSVMVEEDVRLTNSSQSEREQSNSGSSNSSVAAESDSISENYITVLKDENTVITEQLKFLKEENDSLSKRNAELFERVHRNSLYSEVSDGQSTQTENVELQQLETINALKKQKAILEQDMYDIQSDLQEAEAEIAKLTMSIDLLTSSHETEIRSLNASLQQTRSDNSNLQRQINDVSLVREGTRDSIMSLKKKVSSLQNHRQSIQDTLVGVVDSTKVEFENLTALLLHKIASFCNQAPHVCDNTTAATGHSSVTEQDKAADLTELLDCSQLSKADLLIKLADMSRNELSIQKDLSECQRSLQFYRTAIDNIIDCLGSSLPDVKKWVQELFINPDEDNLSVRIEDMISSESALLHRVHSLEQAEQALREGFQTKQQEYESTIKQLHEKLDASPQYKSFPGFTKRSGVVDSTLDLDLSNRFSELETTNCNLRLQIEELQFAYEKENERRQQQEELRYEAEDRCRQKQLLSTKEEEYQNKISNLELRNSELSTNEKRQQAVVDDLKRRLVDQDELTARTEALERSERALLRKIEILQQADSKFTSAAAYSFESTLDGPEDLLRQRLVEMKRLESHLRQQVSELECDREELHEIARTDKNIIHELNIQLAETQLANKNLTSQVSRIEMAEKTLYDKLETVHTELTDTEEKLQTTADSKLKMKQQLEEAEYLLEHATFKNIQLEKRIMELQDADALLKQKQDSSEQDHHVADYSLQSIDTDLTALQSQLSATNSQVTHLRDRVAELETVNSTLRKKLSEFELERESLKAGSYKLEKESSYVKSNLSDMSLSKEQLLSLLDASRSALETAKQKVTHVETEKFKLEKRLQDIWYSYRKLLAVKKKQQQERRTRPSVQQKRTAMSHLDILTMSSTSIDDVVQRENNQLTSENRDLREKLKKSEVEMKRLTAELNELADIRDGKKVGGSYRIQQLEKELKLVREELERVGDRKSSVSTAPITTKRRPSKESSVGGSVNATEGTQSRHAQVLQELLVKAIKTDSVPSNQSITEGDISEKACPLSADEEDMEIQSESSIWDRLEPPVKHISAVHPIVAPPVTPPPVTPLPVTPLPIIAASPLTLSDGSLEPALADTIATTTTADTGAAKGDSRLGPTLPASNADNVPEESSLWEKLELYEPPNKSAVTVGAAKVEVVFEEGPIAPVFCPRKAPSPTLLARVENPLGSEGFLTCDDVSDIDEETVDSEPLVLQTPTPTTEATQSSTPLVTSNSRSELDKFSPATLPHQDKDLSRLKRVVTELEKKLKSRETEIKMLRRRNKELEKEEQLSGDMSTLKSRLKLLQEDLIGSQSKISSLRNELIAKDSLLERKQREITNLKIESNRKQISDISNERAGRLDKLSAITGVASPVAVVDGVTGSDTDSNNRMAALQKQLDEVRRTNKYLDDKYTEVASRCHAVIKQRDELEVKYNSLKIEYDCLKENHSKCPQMTPTDSHNSQSDNRNSEPISQLVCNKESQTGKSSNSLCYKCEDLRRALSQLHTQNYEGPDRGRSDGSGPDRDRPVMTDTSIDIMDETPNHRSTYPSRQNISGLPSTTQPIIYITEPSIVETSAAMNNSEELSSPTHLHIPATSEYSATTSQTSVSSSVPAKDQPQLFSPYNQRRPQYRPNRTQPTVLTELITHTKPTTRKQATTRKEPTVSQSAGSRELGDINRRCRPAAPTDLTVELVKDMGKVYVHWSHPLPSPIDLSDNAVRITGFRVFVNGRPYLDISSAYTMFCTLDMTEEHLSSLHTISVQTLASNNVNSILAHKTVTPQTQLYGRHSPSKSLAHRINSINMGSTLTEDQSKRLYIARYDYNPAVQGSYSRGLKSSYSDELSLRTGDLVTVYGDPLPNGLFWAEAVGGRIGYVPQSFIRQVPSSKASSYGFYQNDMLQSTG